MADGTARTSLGDILSELSTLIVRYGSQSVLVALTVAAFTTLFVKSLGAGGQFLASVASFFIAYHFLAYLLRAEGLADTALQGQRYASMFGVMLLATLGIVAAMTLLIVPGLYVAARWSLAQALVVGEGLGTTEALRESWRRTASAVWPLAGTYFLITVASIIVMIFARRLAGYSLIDPDAARALGGIIASGLTSGLSSVLSVCFAVSTYRLVGRSPAQFHAVFD